MGARLAVAALAALGLGTGVQAAPSYDGNFTARDCAFGGGFQYCGSGDPGGMSTGAGFGGMFLPGSATGTSGGPGAPAPVMSGASGAGATGTGSPGTTGSGGTGATGGGAGTTNGSAFLPPTGTDGGDQLPDEEVVGLPPPTTPQIPVTSVPEPGALALFGVALALLGLTRVRARAHARA